MSALVLTADTLRAQLTARPPKLLEATAATKLSAVAAILRSLDDEPEVMLIKRAEHPNDHWSGHMAFPGGRKDPGDDALIDTARREVLEEVSVNLDADAQLLGRLDDIRAVSKGKAVNMLIAPFVFSLTQSVNVVIDETEVAEVVWTPIAPLMRGEVDCVRPYNHDGRHLELPGFAVGPHIVWGLTYQMLVLLFDVIRQ